MSSSDPLVSVFVPTYNHSQFISGCLNSILAQKTQFSYDIVVHDDASTDGTSEIVRKFATEFDDSIIATIQPKNLWPNTPINPNNVSEACRGKYVAMCEGDDEWTSSTKLQQQIDFLEKNPDYSLICHRVSYIRSNFNQEPHTTSPTTTLQLYPNIESARTICWHELFNTNPIQTCSIVYRREMVSEKDIWMNDYQPRDWALFLTLASRGKIFYEPTVMANYRLHDSSMWSSTSYESRRTQTDRMLREAFIRTVGKHTHLRTANLAKIASGLSQSLPSDPGHFIQQARYAAYGRRYTIKSILFQIHAILYRSTFFK